LSFQKEQILDRARGALLGTAVGDALGAGYEFQPPLARDVPVVFKSSPGLALGQYTDDTAQTIAVALAASTADLSEGLDEVAKEFFRWHNQDGGGIGIQTAAIFRKVASQDSAAELTKQSELFLDTHELAAGNGSLMRTAAVALPFLSKPEVLGDVASAVSALTHADLDCREACIIWSKAIRHAILFENFDGIQLAINELPSFRQLYWNDIFDLADEAKSASDLTKNGWVIHAIQAAYKSIMITATETPEHLVLGIEEAVRVGNDTDTVAAIAGALLGARWGYSAIPNQWLEVIHGWPGFRSSDLVALADDITEPIWL
jgi:ADP-ribosylglycohydrolase